MCSCSGLNLAEKKSEETSENAPEGKTTQMKKRVRGPVKEVATNKKARTENEKVWSTHIFFVYLSA